MPEPTIYHCDWKDSGRDGMIGDFSITAEDLVGAEILYATYTYEDYSGSAFVLFRRDGKLYEVNGGHCSCYGLEGQWEPEETTVEALDMRKFSGIPDEDVAELRRVIAAPSVPSPTGAR